VKNAEIINTYNLLVTKLQGTLRDHVAELPKPRQHNVTENFK
jgi:hypothetical protein